jgi:transposase
MTGHSPRGGVLQVGRGGDVARIYRIADAVDGLYSKKSQKGIKHGQRWQMRKVDARISAKIRQIVQDLHEKLDNFFASAFPVSFFQNLRHRNHSSRLKKIQNQNRGSIGNVVAFGRIIVFLECLLQKSRKYPCCQVIVVSEAYTCITCGMCGQTDSKLGGRKIFYCSHYKMRCDRDVNGARNILLRFLTE